MEKIKSFLPDLFAALNTDDSIAVLVFLGVSFLLGLLFGAWSRAGKINRLKRELAQKETDLKELRIQYDTLVGQYETKEQELKDSEVRFGEMTEDINKLSNERMHYQTELRSAREQLERLQRENLTYAAQVEELQSGTTDLNPVVSSTSTSDSQTTDDSTDNKTVAPEANNDRLALIEEKLERLVLENANLKEEIASIEKVALTAGAGAVVVGAGASMSGGGTATSADIVTDKGVLDLSETTVVDAPPTYESEVLEEDYSEMSPQERASRAKARIAALVGTKIPSATPEEKDDLKKLEGIGPFIEMKLNDIGIFTYEQISMFDEDMIDLITDAIQFFPGRIQKDDWMGQAAKQMESII
ncbi:MAG TPA: hypothetical protein ENJ53_04990 [Phaeodactylibacter sp.]|nr:hypothetical protein [Phaeodactylibacter sp.]